MSDNPKVIMLREGVIQSWAKDAVTFGALAALPWFNWTYAGGSAWINAAIAFAWFISIIARASGQRKAAEMSPDEARAFLDIHFPEGAANDPR